MVASIAALQGCGSVFIQRSRSIACGGKRSFGVDLATAVLHAVTYLLLVNIQSDVIHKFHGGASLVSLNQRPLSSAFLDQALLLRSIHSNYRDLGKDLSVGGIKPGHYRHALLDLRETSDEPKANQIFCFGLPYCLARFVPLGYCAVATASIECCHRVG